MLKFNPVNSKASIENLNWEHKSFVKEIAWDQSHLVRAPIANLLGCCDLLMRNKRIESDMETSFMIKLIYKEVLRLDNSVCNIINKTSIHLNKLESSHELV
jgi:K+-sensing histidine kinase KdpD